MRTFLKWLTVFAGLILLASLFLPLVVPANGFFTKRIIETLSEPVQVDGWTTNGLQTSDGRTIALPGVANLPAELPGLSAATEQGIEIQPDGRVFGLIRIHHWCGNDPVREHVARVDLSYMAIYFSDQPVESKSGMNLGTLRPTHNTNVFSEHGWRYGDFLTFQSWCKLAEH